MRVFVKYRRGQKLMPCSQRKVRVLMKEKKAKKKKSLLIQRRSGILKILKSFVARFLDLQERLFRLIL